MSEWAGCHRHGLAACAQTGANVVLMKTVEALRELGDARHLARSGIGRSIRRSASVSLRELAAALALPPSTLSRWERGVRQPRGPAAVRWVRGLRELIGERS